MDSPSFYVKSNPPSVGNWIAPTPIPKQSHVMLESGLEDNELLLVFTRSMLT